MYAPGDIKQAADAPRCGCVDKHVHREVRGDKILVLKLCFRCGTIEAVDEVRAA